MPPSPTPIYDDAERPMPEIGVEPIASPNPLQDDWDWSPPVSSMEVCDGIAYPVCDDLDSETLHRRDGWNRCMLRAMGLKKAIAYVGFGLWLDALEVYAQERGQLSPEVVQALGLLRERLQELPETHQPDRLN